MEENAAPVGETEGNDGRREHEREQEGILESPAFSEMTFPICACVEGVADYCQKRRLANEKKKAKQLDAKEAQKNTKKEKEKRKKVHRDYSCSQKLINRPLRQKILSAITMPQSADEGKKRKKQKVSAVALYNLPVARKLPHALLQKQQSSRKKTQRDEWIVEDDAEAEAEDEEQVEVSEVR